MHKLESMSGRPQDFSERVEFANLTDSIELLKIEIAAETQVLNYLEECQRSSQIEYEAEVKYDLSKQGTLFDEIESMKARSDILHNYIGIMSTEEFLINKVKNENDEYCKIFWLKLKQITDRGREVANDLEQLKDMHSKCIELKHKANNLMAPSY